MSGGIDSTALIKYYLNLDYKVNGLYINYGQLSNSMEIRAVEKIGEHYGIQVAKSKIDLNKNFKSGEIIGRNLMLLSIALTDFTYDYGTIAIGIHSGTNYSDCTPNFIKTTQESFDIYKDGRVQIEAPFMNMLKSDIWNFCIDQNVPLSLTYSCENGNIKGCGQCLSCKDKESLYEFSKKQ